jgi:hypothetical protein
MSNLDPPTRCPVCNSSAQPEAVGCGVCGHDFAVDPPRVRGRRRLDDPLDLTLSGCTVIGGCGFALEVGEMTSLLMRDRSVTVVGETGAKIHLEAGNSLIAVDASGPGVVTSGMNFSFFFKDFESFASGFLVTTVLNRLLSRSEIHTLLALITTDGELFLHYGGQEPAALRVQLSPLFTSLRLASE